MADGLHRLEIAREQVGIKIAKKDQTIEETRSHFKRLDNLRVQLTINIKDARRWNDQRLLVVHHHQNLSLFTSFPCVAHGVAW
jgi:hypothetical protein